MDCERPFTLDGKAFGCGQCLPCRINTRRVWTHRIILEASQYADNTFATLTYSDENLPVDNSVSPREVSLFVKRLRKAYPTQIRYFACGEYGDHTMRPHYHIAIFGHANCRRGITRHDRRNTPCCEICESVRRAWGLGGISLGRLEAQSAAYIAAYTTKKMTKHDDPRLEGRLPEFARMSRRPGIGVGFMHDVASALLEHSLDEKMVDVPFTLQHGSTKLPLGRFLRKKLRTFIGRSDMAPQGLGSETEWQARERERMQALREIAFRTSTSFTKAILDDSLGKRIQIEAKHNRFKKRSTL